MDDDFNTAQAVAVLFDVARDVNRFADEGFNVISAQQLLSELAGVLGLTLKPPQKPSLDAGAGCKFGPVRLQRLLRRPSHETRCASL